MSGICRCIECKQVVQISDTNQGQYGHVCAGKCTDAFILRMIRERRENSLRATEERIVKHRKQWWEI